MDTENIYGYSFKQRCIAVFLAYTADPKIKYLTQKQLDELSANLWIACKKELKGKITKKDVVFSNKDVEDLVVRRNELFEKNENGYKIKGWSIRESGAVIFERTFLTGRINKEAKVTKKAWDLTFNKNQNENN